MHSAYLQAQTRAAFESSEKSMAARMGLVVPVLSVIAFFSRSSEHPFQGEEEQGGQDTPYRQRNDPGNDDAADDPDGDGLTNLQEYNLGRHPTNVEPDKPVLLLPDDNATDVLLTAELQTQNFTDTDDDFHAQSQWQIGKQIDNPQPCPEESFTNSDYIVFDVGN